MCIYIYIYIRTYFRSGDFASCNDVNDAMRLVLYMYTYIYIYIYVYMSLSLSLYIYIYVYMYMYVCMYIYIYIYTYHEARPHPRGRAALPDARVGAKRRRGAAVADRQVQRKKVQHRYMSYK